MPVAGKPPIGVQRAPDVSRATHRASPGRRHASPASRRSGRRARGPRRETRRAIISSGAAAVSAVRRRRSSASSQSFEQIRLPRAAAVHQAERRGRTPARPTAPDDAPPEGSRGSCRCSSASGGTAPRATPLARLALVSIRVVMAQSGQGTTCRSTPSTLLVSFLSAPDTPPTSSRSRRCNTASTTA